MKALALTRRIPLILIQLRSFYFVTGLAGGLLNPYLSTIFIEGGLDSKDVGVIMSCSSLLVIGSQLIWGRLADRYQMTKTILLLSLAIPAAAAMLYQIPSIPLLILSYMIAMVFTAPQAPISDAYAVTAARSAGSSYGTIRSFQSIGNAIGGYAAGLFVAHYAANLLGLPFLLFSCLGLAAVLTFPRRSEVQYTGGTFFSGMSQVLANKTVILFLGACLLINQTLTAFNTYFIVVFQMAGGSYELSGVALMIAALSNVPSMFLASFIIRKIGIEQTMLVGALVYIVRWAIQYALPIPGVMVGVQVLQGLSFGLFYVAAVEYMVQLVPKELRATGQSLFNVVFVGMAGIAGNLLNGFLLETGGPSFMNLACTISAGCGAFLLLRIVREVKKNPSTSATLTL